MTNEKLKKLIHHMNELEHIWADVLDCYDEATKEYYGLHDKFTEEYPFEKSFDEYIIPLAEWRISIEEYLKEVEK